MSEPLSLSPAAHARRTSLLLASMWFAYVLNYGDRQAIFSMFPVLKTELGLTDTQLGLTGSIFLWVYGLGCPIAGLMADRYSKRRLLVASLIIWSGVTMATGFVQSAVLLLALRAAMGLSESLFMPAAIAYTANAYGPALRSRAIAALTTAQIVGTVGGAWFGGWMAQHGRWREAFWLLGLGGLLYAVPYLLVLRSFADAPPAPPPAGRTRFAGVELALIPTYLVLCVVFPSFVFGLWLIYGWLPTMLREKFALSLGDAAFNATAFLQAATLVGLVSGGWLADRLSRRVRAGRLWLLAASLISCAPCLAALAAVDTLNATRAAAVGFGFSSGFFMGNIFPSAFEIVPARLRASAVGVLNLFGACVSGFAPYLGGRWKSTLGVDGLLHASAWIYGGAALLLLGAIVWLFPKDSQRVQSESAATSADGPSSSAHR